MVTSSVLVKALVPWPLWWEAVGNWLIRSPIPLPPNDTWPIGPVGLGAWGWGQCVTICLSPPLSSLGDQGKQDSSSCYHAGVVTSCYGVCPGTWCSCSAGGSLSWRWCHQSGISPGQNLRPSTLPQEAAREKDGNEELGWGCCLLSPEVLSVSRFPMKLGGTCL